MDQDPRTHWQHVYETKAPTEVSWYQSEPTLSLEFIQATGVSKSEPIIDVGGGASLLVDCLSSLGYSDVSVLDVSAAALDLAKARMGAAADKIRWVSHDITQFQPDRAFALWHDRAFFHFLVDPDLRERYLQSLRASLRPGAHVILATFGPQGPLRCSGLETQRYSADELSILLGPTFQLVRRQIEVHSTPSGGSQQFQYGWWRADA